MTALVAATLSDAEAALAAFEASVEHHYADNDGVRIHYAATGAGPLLVFLHGFPDHWLGWWQVMDSLRVNYRVVALDLRGYNLSDQPAEQQAYAVSELVMDVQAVVSHEDAERATIIGHDWGGFVAWHVAMDVPAIVESLVVLNMPHPWAISRELASNPAQQKASEYVKLFSHPQSHLQFPRERLAAWVNDPAFKTRQQQAMDNSSLNGMLNYYRVNWPTPPCRQHAAPPPKVHAPTLLMHGLQDPYALPAGLNDVWQWVDNELDIYTLPEAAHFIQHDHAPAVTARLQQWLARRG
ncbi:MAG: alpha/beta hydrolase [Pseudomonadales bacterium]|nr:alpha/beta hydrolase [Pseudomonadales bacterium]|tara:strand:+ start:426 stop:1313 length:888 start_codon:yes stop_codon:yes gene_type:complete